MRGFILAALVAGYAAVFVGMPGREAGSRFDPLDPQGRQVEQRIETGRFADALPLALDLQRAHPDEPLIAYWLAEIHRGLAEEAGQSKLRLGGGTSQVDF